VHGRTTVQRFKGCANWDAIGEVVAAVDRIPVIGNGDVIEPDDAVRLMRHSGCAGVMIARAAIRTPWIFRRAHAAIRLAEADGELGPAPGIAATEPLDDAVRIDCETALAEPTLIEKFRAVQRHIDLSAEHQSERIARELMRQRISWYGKSMGHVKPLKEAIRVAPDLASMRRACDAWIDWALSEPGMSTETMAPRGVIGPDGSIAEAESPSFRGE
jgi:tRNA-dihydrouridine synthase B